MLLKVPEYSEKKVWNITVQTGTVTSNETKPNDSNQIEMLTQHECHLATFHRGNRLTQQPVEVHSIQKRSIKKWRKKNQSS
ncbi:MAG: hypothetical protein C4527_07510 [Candidatus Omnitrophota bacterium]|nr:MAG: hypothetical protein C4527_07510 [Candidatus Omnitrophota bacterium]